MGNSSDKSKIGGILSIVSGAIGILYVILFIFMVIMMAFMPGWVEDTGEAGQEDANLVFTMMAVVYGLMGLLWATFCVLAIVGGVYALKRRKWGLALAGAVSSTIAFFPSGIPTLIFISMGKSEFDSAQTPDESEYQTTQNNSEKIKTSGILSIISGIMSLLYTVFLVIMIIMFSALPMPNEETQFFDYMSTFMLITYGCMGLYMLITGILAIIGGRSALTMKNWKWALTGVIAATMAFCPTGIPAVILAVQGKNEFNNTTQPASIYTTLSD